METWNGLVRTNFLCRAEQTKDSMDGVDEEFLNTDQQYVYSRNEYLSNVGKTGIFQSMRNLLACAFLLVQFLVIAPPANAAFDGCPNQWSIPQNLMDATPEQIRTLYSPAFDTVIRPSSDSQYSFDGISWITVKGLWTNIPKPELAVQRNYDVSTLMSYFSNHFEDVTLVRLGDLSWIREKRVFLKTSISVSKQGCASPALFFYLKEYTPPTIEVLSFASEVEKFKERFRNFEFFESALSKYAKCLSNWNGYNKSVELRKPLDTCYLGDIRGNSGGTDAPIAVNLLPNEPGCLEFLKGNPSVASTVGIKAGTSCTYSILGFKGENYLGWADHPSSAKLPLFYDAATDKIISFGTLKISPKVILKSITCIKGGVTKKLSGSNSKCPKGFMRK